MNTINNFVHNAMRGGAVLVAVGGAVAIGAGSWRIINHKRQNPPIPANGAAPDQPEAPIKLQTIRDLEIVSFTISVTMALYAMLHLTVSFGQSEWAYFTWDLLDVAFLAVLAGVTATQAWAPISAKLSNKTAGILEIVFGSLAVLMTIPWLLFTFTGRKFYFVDYLSGGAAYAPVVEM